MSLADQEKSIRDLIISKLNADATTKSPDIVRDWHRSEPGTQRRLPFGYVQFNRRRPLPERDDHTRLSYEYEFEIGVVQKVTRTQEQESDDFVTDLLAKVETVLVKNLDLDATVENVSLAREKTIQRGSSRELGDIAFGTLIHRVQKSLDARL